MVRFLRIQTLQRRLVVFLLVPIGLVLVLAGAAGFVRARWTILQEWQEAAGLSLARAAHELDMRLRAVQDWVLAFQESSREVLPSSIQGWILGQLEKQSWVRSVWWRTGAVGPEMGTGEEALGITGHVGGHGSRLEGTRPVVQLHADPTHGILRMEALVRTWGGEPMGTLDISVDLQALLGEALRYGWRHSEQACLVDEDGRFLAHAGTLIASRGRLGENGDALEIALLSEIGRRPSGTVWGPGMPPALIAGFQRLDEAPWTIVVFARGKDVLAPILRFRDYYLGALVLVVVAVLLMIRLIVGPRAKTIQELSRAATEVAQGGYILLDPPRGDDEISRLVRSFNEMVAGLKQRDFLSETFGRYVDPEIAREILSRPEATRLGGEKRAVAILIADLRGFTPLAESLSPERTIQVLNRFFGLLIRIIQRHKGIIVDFFGDSVLAFFDPLEGPLKEAVGRAVLCAFEMQSAMGAFNERNRGDGLPELEMGVGVHAGEVIVGNIGSESRAKYGIVGSAVNLTQRIQQLAGTREVVVSDRAYIEAQELIVPKKVLDASLKGVQGYVRIYLVEMKRENEDHH